jgi:hypothetical protein
VGAARGCQAGRRWAGWVALLIGAASAPQASVSGFRRPYTIPDTATAALGILLAITILATACRTEPSPQDKYHDSFGEENDFCPERSLPELDNVV